MLDVDKQPDWEDLNTGVVSLIAPLDCLQPLSENRFTIDLQGADNGTENYPLQSTNRS